MYRLNEQEQREVYKRLVALPAADIRDRVTEQLKEVDGVPDVSGDPRRGILQSYVDRGDKLESAPAESDRAERRKQYALAFMLGNAILDDVNKDLIDPEMYYRGSSAIGRYVAAGKRMVVAMTISVKYLDDEALDFVLKFMKPANVWILALILAGLAAAAFWGGWLAVVINGVLYAVGVYDLVQRADKVLDNLESFGTACLNATDDKDLDKAAQSFAKGATLALLTLLELWVLSKLFKVVEAGFSRRFTAPSRLQRLFGERARSESARRKAEAERKKADENKADEKKSDDERPDEKKSDEKKSDEGKADESRRKTDDSGNPIKVIGGKRLADELSDDSGFGWLALIGLGIGLAYAAGRRRG